MSNFTHFCSIRPMSGSFPYYVVFLYSLSLWYSTLLNSTNIHNYSRLSFRIGSLNILTFCESDLHPLFQHLHDAFVAVAPCLLCILLQEVALLCMFCHNRTEFLSKTLLLWFPAISCTLSSLPTNYWIPNLVFLITSSSIWCLTDCVYLCFLNP